MKYDYILIRYGEMTTKGKNRNRFVRILKENIASKLKRFSNLQYDAQRDRMYIRLNRENHVEIMDELETIFGIHSYSLALKAETEIEAMKQGALVAFTEARGEAKTFKVSAHRSYKKFPLDTFEIHHAIGSHILTNTIDVTVDVHNPDVIIRVEVRADAAYIMCGMRMGAGGYPVGTGGKGMLLLSGGIDSPVAGYLAMKRGVTIEAVHFHSPPFTSERSKQKVLDLANLLTKFGRRIVVHVVPFTEIQKIIHQAVPSNYEMTVMRRMMMRIAERLAEKRHAAALFTGESLGQVASQTLESMRAINAVTNYPVVRPLATMDKLEIIGISKEIGTYETSILPYEDCCTIFNPANPATKPKKEKAEHFEGKFDFETLIETTMENVEVIIFDPAKQGKKDKFADLL